jgi:coproporphyrinogen III oxidase-like Fe-S oxidoreductase
MYKYAAGYLRAKGYEHYEVSSYARVPHRRDDAAFATQTVGRNANDGGEVQKSYRSQHNQIYWALNGQWFAIGLGATSFINGRTVARPRALADYQRWVEAKVAGGVGIDDATSGKVESSSDVDFLTDTVLKRLRTIEGLSMDWVRDRYGAAYTDAILRGSQLGIDLSLACVDRDTNMLRLQDPDGFLFSNSIIASIFVELERVSSREGAHKESTAEALPGAVP